MKKTFYSTNTLSSNYYFGSDRNGETHTFANGDGLDFCVRRLQQAFPNINGASVIKTTINTVRQHRKGEVKVILGCIGDVTLRNKSFRLLRGTEYCIRHEFPGQREFYVTINPA